MQSVFEETRTDAKGFTWKVNLSKSTRYPNGNFNILVLESPWGAKDFTRFDQAGGFIAGNPVFA